MPNVEVINISTPFYLIEINSLNKFIDFNPSTRLLRDTTQHLILKRYRKPLGLLLHTVSIAVFRTIENYCFDNIKIISSGVTESEDSDFDIGVDWIDKARE